jgi:hypothetical protein
MLQLVSDTKTGLVDLLAAADSTLTKERRTAFTVPRADELSRISTESRLRVEKEVSASLGQSPIHPYELGKVLAESLDKNAIIVSENLTGRYESTSSGAGLGRSCPVAAPTRPRCTSLTLSRKEGTIHTTSSQVRVRSTKRLAGGDQREANESTFTASVLRKLLHVTFDGPEDGPVRSLDPVLDEVTFPEVAASNDDSLAL